MSLNDYWDAFWGDDAPYYVHAILRDTEDILIEERGWGEPAPNFGPVLKDTVIQERYINRSLRVYEPLAPKHCAYIIHVQLLKKTET